MAARSGELSNLGQVLEVRGAVTPADYLSYLALLAGHLQLRPAGRRWGPKLRSTGMRRDECRYAPTVRTPTPWRGRVHGGQPGSPHGRFARIDHT